MYLIDYYIIINVSFPGIYLSFKAMDLKKSFKRVF